MGCLANAILGRVKAVSILLLILLFASAPLVCAAMASMTPACAHPCCPKPAPASSDPCAQMGCISALALLQPESITHAIEFPAAVLPYSPFIPEESHSESVLSLAPESRESGLFLRLHQFLV
jgi:hypothetical protein